jgi:flagellar hook-associated protein 1 FlgK
VGADLFSIGRSSMNTAKKSMATTSHNIANANDDNFSRQQVTTETNTPVAEGDYVVGTGVNIREIKRVHNKLVEKKLSHSISQHKYNEERTEQLLSIEEVFNEINSDGMNKVLNRFFNSFRELSNQPDNEVVRTMVRDNARLVVEDFKRIDSSITNIKDNIDKKLENAVDEINQAAKTIASLNKEIVRLENMGGETGDLRDQRDKASRLISEYMAINTYQDEKGQYVVNIAGTGSLVAGGAVNELKAARVRGNTGNIRDEEGQVEIFFASNTNMRVSDNLRKGALKGLLDTRNNEVVNLRSQVDNLAYGLAKATNAIHRRGFVNRPISFDQQGNPVSRDGSKVTGIEFFKLPITVDRAAEYLDISDDVKNDLSNIATAVTPNSPGDNRIAIAISKLQHEKILGEGQETFEESYLKSVGTIGLKSAKSKIDTEQSAGILAQSKSIKNRISGVSIDEETANLVRYQHSYDASARVLRAADEMFDSVLGMMR